MARLETEERRSGAARFAIVAEDKRVTADEPQDRDEARDADALREHAEHVLFAHEAAVEERQAGQRHEQHQRGANHHESIVAGPGTPRFSRSTSCHLNRQRRDFGNTVRGP
jgi:hypothetical protein